MSNFGAYRAHSGPRPGASLWRVEVLSRLARGSAHVGAAMHWPPEHRDALRLLIAEGRVELRDEAYRLITEAATDCGSEETTDPETSKPA